MDTPISFRSQACLLRVWRAAQTSSLRRESLLALAWLPTGDQVTRRVYHIPLVLLFECVFERPATSIRRWSFVLRVMLGHVRSELKGRFGPRLR